jgi:hypothetical protein
MFDLGLFDVISLGIAMIRRKAPHPSEELRKPKGGLMA